jgi:hypothetical protein
MTQDELNQELDHFLEEGIFNGDLDGKDVDLMRRYVCAMVKEVDGIEVTDEQWLFYTSHCLQTSTESLLRKRDGRVQ